MEKKDKPPLELSVADLRRHFLVRSDPPPPLVYSDDAIDFKGLYDESQSSAAVLIPILDKPQGPQLLLTRRADHLRSHAGQISFPGGRVEEPGETHIQAALREANEEINLPFEKVEVVGLLGDYYTISGFRVTPVIGIIEPPVSLKPDPSEVAEIFEVPFNHLMNPAVFNTKETRHGDLVRRYYSTYYRQHHIWGVTAGILMGFYQELLEALAD